MDSRDFYAMKGPVKTPVLVIGDEERELPYKMEVCDLCRGHGTHVNPSIDSHGLTSEDFDEDPGFREEYFAGAYDQTCNKCGGMRVVPVADESKMDALTRNLWKQQQEEEAYSDNERAAELRCNY